MRPVSLAITCSLANEVHVLLVSLLGASGAIWALETSLVVCGAFVEDEGARGGEKSAWWGWSGGGRVGGGVGWAGTSGSLGGVGVEGPGWTGHSRFGVLLLLRGRWLVRRARDHIGRGPLTRDQRRTPGTVRGRGRVLETGHGRARERLDGRCGLLGRRRRRAWVDAVAVVVETKSIGGG